MTLSEYIEKLPPEFTVLNRSENTDSITLTKIFCCDLLSFAMARNPHGSVWVTVMGNINSIAVMELTDGGCLVLAENAAIDEKSLDKARENDITVIRTELPVFEAADLSNKLINHQK
ncbi:MAG: hypothetical protein LBM87_08080 [Ruminococcus sp.]|nr:hypothetical protein [Ruminococcus sp.]